MGQSYIKAIFGRYRLHSIHGQFYGRHFLIPDLKALKVFTSFNSVATISQILRPKNDRLSVHLYFIYTIYCVELKSAKCRIVDNL